MKKINVSLNHRAAITSLLPVEGSLAEFRQYGTFVDEIAIPAEQHDEFRAQFKSDPEAYAERLKVVETKEVTDELFVFVQKQLVELDSAGKVNANYEELFDIFEVVIPVADTTEAQK